MIRDPDCNRRQWKRIRPNRQSVRRRLWFE